VGRLYITDHLAEFFQAFQLRPPTAHRTQGHNEDTWDLQSMRLLGPVARFNEARVVQLVHHQERTVHGIRARHLAKGTRSADLLK
jgi:hypothetical protein